MSKKMFSIGLLFTTAVIVVVGVMLYMSAPVEAAATTEQRQWCESENAGYEGALPTQIVRYNTWAIMTANIYAIANSEVSSLGRLTEEQAQDMACRILYNVYHPGGRR